MLTSWESWYPSCACKNVNIFTSINCLLPYYYWNCMFNTQCQYKMSKSAIAILRKLDFTNDLVHITTICHIKLSLVLPRTFFHKYVHIQLLSVQFCWQTQALLHHPDGPPSTKHFCCASFDPLWCSNDILSGLEGRLLQTPKHFLLPFILKLSQTKLRQVSYLHHAVLAKPVSKMTQSSGMWQIHLSWFEFVC